MLTSGQGMYLLVPTGSNKPVLIPGKVTESTGSSFAIILDGSCNLKAGLETLAYCDVRGKFFQQGATLAEITPTLPKSTYVFTRVGEPVSAEQRQTFRVSVALSDINAQVGDRKYCQVVDLSPEGVAIISHPGLNIGTMVKVTVNHQEDSLSADARVQTIKELPSGKLRYGLLVPNTNARARRTLLKMSMSFQRTQLKRLAGAA